jgi:hypothetical protein
LQCLQNGGGTQPLIKAWGTHSIEYYAL